MNKIPTLTSGGTRCRTLESVVNQVAHFINLHAPLGLLEYPPTNFCEPWIRLKFRRSPNNQVQMDILFVEYGKTNWLEPDASGHQLGSPQINVDGAWLYAETTTLYWPRITVLPEASGYDRNPGSALSHARLLKDVAEFAVELESLFEEPDPEPIITGKWVTAEEAKAPCYCGHQFSEHRKTHHHGTETRPCSVCHCDNYDYRQR